MGLWDLEGLLEGGGGFDHGGDEAGRDVPFDVAVEEPDARVIGAEAQDYVAVWADHEGIAAHGDGGESAVAGVGAGGVVGADEGLEGVAVEVEGVFAGVGVVEDDVDDLVFGEDEGVGVYAVDGGVVGGGAGGEGGVEGWDFGLHVGYIVEEGAGEWVSGWGVERFGQEGESLLVCAVA